MEIIDCAICAKPPEWDEWIIGKDNTILWALRCSNGIHWLSTSYWDTKDKAVEQWNEMMKKFIDGVAVMEPNFFDDVRLFN